MKLTKNVTVIIEDNELIRLFLNAIYPKAAAAEGKEKTLFLTFGNLTGCSDVQAVKVANRKAAERGWPKIKVDEFRRWLPTILSEAFDGYVKGGGR